MKKLFLDFVFWKSPGKTHFHSVDCSISVHSVLRTPCTEKEQSTPWKWFYLTFSRKLHKKLLFPYCFAVFMETDSAAPYEAIPFTQAPG